MPPPPNFQQYEAAVADVRARLAAYAAAVWAGIQFTDAAMETLVALIVPKVLAGQLRVANLTSAYFARATGTAPAAVAEAVTLGRGIAPELVYERPIITTRTAVSQGKPVAAAKEAGARRLESLVTTDLQMAKIRQADTSLAHAGVQYYRRVPKGAGTCALCLIASTQRYKTGKLSPIHPGCDCGVDVIPAGNDFEVETNELLEATHAKVEEFAGIADRGGRAVDYRKLIVTHEHGEIGSVLAWKGDHFDSPADIPDMPSVVNLDA